MTRLTDMAAFLLVYDRGTGTFVRKTRFDGSNEALRARFDAEAEFAATPNIEIVVLEAESEDALRRTHGRYFLSLDELVDRIA